MRHIVSSDHLTYSFSRRHEPALTVAPGDEVLLQCHDCMDNLIPLVPDGDGFRLHDPARGNPATGPVAVEGALPGMTLAVEVIQVSCAERGLIWATERSTGLLSVRIPEIDGAQVGFAPGMSFPFDPMIGVIGVAPPTGAIPNTTPGRHGGNLDCADIKPGATIYLPVTVPGALFGCGDIHALQADGEVSGMGIEVAGEVLVRLDLLPRIVSPWPVVEQAGHFAVLTAASTLDEAADLAVAAARDLLRNQLGVDDAEALMLQGMLCDLRVNQIVDPLKGARVCIPKSLLPVIDWE
ncbi:MAG: acetamidase/formamidase family protein [Armatimonadia bacterium]